MEYREQLLSMIDRLISGEVTVPEFRDIYYDFYLEQVPDELIEERDSNFFGLIQEMLDWTAEDPPDEDERCGWMSYEEFRKWVANQRAEYMRSAVQS